MFDNVIIKKQLPFCLQSTNFLSLGQKYTGKVRDNYIQGNKRIMIATDKLSAFDRIICLIPFKGQVLTQTSFYWFQNTKDIIKNHALNLPDPQVLIAEECTPIPIEMVIRGYLSGVTTTSAWYMYEQGARTIYGYKMPDKMRKNQKFDHPIITPTTKAPKGQHDEPMTLQEILDRNLLSKNDLDQLVDITRTLFKRGGEMLARQGLILVDTKYEFGKDQNGNIVLIDELHTPDSSRFWFQESYNELLNKGEEQRKLDKEYLREWLAAQGFLGDGEIPEVPDNIKVETARRYIEAYELITSKTFDCQLGQVNDRIERNIQPYMQLEKVMI